MQWVMDCEVLLQARGPSVKYLQNYEALRTVLMVYGTPCSDLRHLNSPQLPSLVVYDAPEKRLTIGLHQVHGAIKCALIGGKSFISESSQTDPWSPHLYRSPVQCQVGTCSYSMSIHVRFLIVHLEVN